MLTNEDIQAHHAAQLAIQQEGEAARREHLARHVRILVPSWSEADGPDWNIACNGRMMFYPDTDTAVIGP